MSADAVVEDVELVDLDSTMPPSTNPYATGVEPSAPAQVVVIANTEHATHHETHATAGDGAPVQSSEGYHEEALTADQEQLARLKAYDEMGDMIAASLFKKSRDVLIPDAVTRGVGTMFHAVDVVVDHIPRPVTDLANFAGENVRVLATTTANMIEAAPDALVNVIPEFIMSKDTKQLLFVDFNNTLRSFFHTNILAMPYVFNETGLVTGLCLTAFVAACSLYATETFMIAKNQLVDARKVMVYGDVPRLTFGDWYPSINIFYGVIHLISFQAFAAHNTQVMLKAMGLNTNGYLLGLLIPACISIPLVFMKQAKHQRPLSIVSNFVIFLSVITMMFYFPYTDFDEVQTSSSGSRLIIALGVVIYAFTGIGSAIPVERTMDPKRYVKLLRIAVVLSFVLLVTFGLSGYISYGQQSCAVITLSLQPGRTKTAISVMMFIASIAIIPQQVFPFAEVMDRRLLGLRTVPKYWDREPNLARCGAIAGCALVAYLFPYYGLILSIGGAVGCGILGLIIPAGLDYSRRRRRAILQHRGLRPWEYIMIVLMGGFGLFTLVTGVLFSLYDMWFKLQQGNSAGQSTSCSA